MSAAGAVVFRAAGSRAGTPVWHVFTSVEREQLGARQSDLIGEVDVNYNTHLAAGLTPQVLTPVMCGFLPDQKRSQMCVSCSSEIPGPVSETAKLTSLPMRSALTLTEPIRGVNLMALPRRLERICSTRSRSQYS